MHRSDNSLCRTFCIVAHGIVEGDVVVAFLSVFIRIDGNAVNQTVAAGSRDSSKASTPSLAPPMTRSSGTARPARLSVTSEPSMGGVVRRAEISHGPTIS